MPIPRHQRRSRPPLPRPPPPARPAAHAPGQRSRCHRRRAPGPAPVRPAGGPRARNHDLVLHARVAGYQRAWCEQWLYGPDRRLIELYNKSLNLAADGASCRTTASAGNAIWPRSRPNGRLLKEQADVAQAILRRLKTDAPLSTAACSASTATPSTGGGRPPAPAARSWRRSSSPAASASAGVTATAVTTTSSSGSCPRSC